MADEYVNRRMERRPMYPAARCNATSTEGDFAAA